ncbi:hypothetical protein Xsto_02447 [Xenorhabdus stockiae]|uniref:Uncharacterized protein n=1 Tax=Xenorhabdus stockiae TaxID=351614 RepID=A0A2D0KNW6_9GAMM|nr:hypothetical protein [Xenorhabdus stockiae]PHM64985.1 hypothetical protein Xsto_02447 [Xenorhabdus stockiae]
MIDRKNIVDGILIEDVRYPDKYVIFNFYTWVELLKGIIVNYAKKSENEAEHLIMNDPLIHMPINNFRDVDFFSHELEYHWAMLIAYGPEYWTKGISARLPEDYMQWEENYIKEHKLAEDCFVYSDE